MEDENEPNADAEVSSWAHSKWIANQAERMGGVMFNSGFPETRPIRDKDPCTQPWGHIHFSKIQLWLPLRTLHCAEASMPSPAVPLNAWFLGAGRGHRNRVFGGGFGSSTSRQARYIPTDKRRGNQRAAKQREKYTHSALFRNARMQAMPAKDYRQTRTQSAKQTDAEIVKRNQDLKPPSAHRAWQEVARQ